MTDYTKNDFILTTFKSVADMETAAASLVACEGRVSSNISRAAWGLAVIVALQQPDLSAKAIAADVALAMNLEAAKGGRHQPLVSRLRSALTYVRADASPIAFPKVTGADNEQTVIAKAERFIGRNALTTVAAASLAVRSDKSEARKAERDTQEAKAERDALALAGVTAKMPFSLTAITESDDYTGLLAATRSGDENALRMAEYIMRHVQAAIVAGTVVREERAAKKTAKRPARKVALRAVA